MSGGRTWTTGEVRLLHELRAKRVRVADIARRLGRTECAISNFLRYVPAGQNRGPSLAPTPAMPPREEPEASPRFWTNDEMRTLRSLAEGGATTREAAEALGRSIFAVRCKAADLDIHFTARRSHSIYRLEQETTRFHKNAVEGSAMLRDAILTALAA